MTSGIKFELKFNGQGKQVFNVVYTQKTWEALKNKLEKLGLETSNTVNAWGRGIEQDYYRENARELIEFIKEQTGRYSYADNINDEFLTDSGKVNIAVLRVVPKKVGRRYITEVVLEKYLTVANLRNIMNALVHAYNVLFNIVTDEISVEVKVKGV
jgi:hypothetical protein